MTSRQRKPWQTSGAPDRANRIGAAKRRVLLAAKNNSNKSNREGGPESLWGRTEELSVRAGYITCSNVKINVDQTHLEYPIKIDMRTLRTMSKRKW